MSTDTLAAASQDPVTWNLFWFIVLGPFLGLLIWAAVIMKRSQSDLAKLRQKYKSEIGNRPPVDVVNHPAGALFRGEVTVFTPTAPGPLPLPELNQIANHYGYFYVGDRPSRWSSIRTEHVFIKSNTPPPLPVPHMGRPWGYGK